VKFQLVVIGQEEHICSENRPPVIPREIVEENTQRGSNLSAGLRFTAMDSFTGYCFLNVQAYN